MLRIPTSRLLLAGLLLAAGGARAQQPAPDTARLRPLARNLFGLGFGFGLATVNPDDDYYLPNDGVKFGSEVGFTYTRFFSQQQSALPAYELRTGLGLLGRSGTYRFFGPYQGREVRRTESLLAVPLELVVRRRWAPTSRWYSTLAFGGYFGELVSRYSYTLDAVSGKTQRATDSWVYATGGLSFNLSIGYQASRHSYRELGFRTSGDLFTPRSPGAGELPNLRQSNLSLYYTVVTGF